MSTLILAVMDWDVTWIGLGRLRPHRREDFLSGRVITLIVFYTSILTLLGTFGMYSIAVGAGQKFVGLEGQSALIAVAATIFLNAFLQVFSASLWNQRAAELQSRFASKMNGS